MTAEIPTQGMIMELLTRQEQVSATRPKELFAIYSVKLGGRAL
jgi:hypothetical protein